jgi:hypothetical protein
MRRVHSGKGGFQQGNSQIVEIEKIFGGTTPGFKKITQDKQHGLNDLMKAKTALRAYMYKTSKNITEAMIEKFELKV